MTKIYQQAFTEVYEILSYLDKESYNKIPVNVLSALRENRDKNYDFFIDTSVSFYEQDILEETKAILFNLYRDYLANSDIKKQILNYQKEEQIVLEKIKSQNYLSSNIFYKNQRRECETIPDNKHTSLIKQKSNNKNIFIKIIEKIKELYNKNN